MNSKTNNGMLKVVDKVVVYPVHETVYGAVREDVHNVVYRAVDNDTNLHGLQDFLFDVGVKV
jgi:hypothetical protein